jgi:protein-S-isoprenylcysteine O-methyltransferase Ste14
MKASAIEFRLRTVINLLIITLGFSAPWIEVWHIGRRMSLLEWLALELSRTGAVSFALATSLILIVAALIAAMAVLFRVCGTAYLGAATVNSGGMVAGKVMTDGPYRYVRNPLYIGLWCMVIALTFLMPATGAALSAILITVFVIRLTLGEEAFLSAKLGEAYQTYVKAVPRFIPRLRGAPSAAGAKPHWIRALMTELTSIGIFVGIVALWRSYELQLAGRIILVFFGASLVARALMPGMRVNSEPAQ